MKLRGRPSRLLFALLPVLCFGLAGEPATKAQDIKALPARGQNPDTEGALAFSNTAPFPTSTKGVVGTKDAPVDGLDGKPHAGPFVDLSASDLRKQASDIKAAANDALVSEDGVMNDPHRKPPRKGTTGTEGGMTEKDRDRKAQEWETGERPAKTPDPPKEAPPVPLNEQERLQKMSLDEATRSVSSKDKIGSNDAEKPKGAAGIEKPTDLPEKPYDIPHPKPIARQIDETLNTVASIPILGTVVADEPSQVEGVHDLIPWDSLFGSFSSIAATEIGDKTFIVAALMAMRHPRFQVFTAAYSALFVMTILSGVAGHAVGALISKRWSAFVAAILFLAFGLKALKEAYDMSPDQGVDEEIKEVEAELEEKEVDMARQANENSAYALEAGLGARTRRSRSRSRLAAPHRSPSTSSFRNSSPAKPSVASAIAGVKNLLSLLISPAWVETFSMTFVGELGDRSQIATVAMAAGQEYYWVMVGACLGHFVCTAVAVMGGSVLAGRVSMRKVTFAGGITFIGFGIFTLYEAQQYFF